MLGRLKPKAIAVIQTPAPGHQGLERLLDLPPFALSLLFSLLLPLPQTLLVSAIAAASLGPDQPGPDRRRQCVDHRRPQ